MSESRVIAALSSGSFDISKHALSRMMSRRIQMADIQCAARDFSYCLEKAPNEYEIAGPDLDGEEITVIAVYEGRTLVVTVFGAREK